MIRRDVWLAASGFFALLFCRVHLSLPIFMGVLRTGFVGCG